MLAYFGLIGLICFYQFITSFLKDNSKRIVFIWLTYFTLAIFIILQEELGPDYSSYMSIYEQIAQVSWGQLFSINLSVEPGFRLVNKLIAMTGLSSWYYIRLYMAVLILLYAIICYKFSTSPFFFTIALISFMFGWFYILRQATATAIVILGYGFIKKRKFIQYIILIVIASLFHISAVLMLAFYPLYSFYKKSEVFRVCTVVMTLGIIIFQKFILEICKAIVKLINDRYLHYFDNVAFAFNMTIILIGMIFLLSIFLDRSKKENNIAINYFYFALLFQTTSLVMPMAGRSMMYVFPLMCLALERVVVKEDYTISSKVLIRTPGKQRYLVAFGLFCFLMFYWWYTFIRENPYVFLFN